MALYGFAPSEEPTLERWLSAIHNDDRAAVQAVAEEAIRRGRDVDHRFRVVRPDGSIVWVADRGRVLLGPDGSPERLVGVNVDVTELVELGRRTAQSGRAPATGDAGCADRLLGLRSGRGNGDLGRESRAPRRLRSGVRRHLRGLLGTGA